MNAESVNNAAENEASAIPAPVEDHNSKQCEAQNEENSNVERSDCHTCFVILAKVEEDSYERKDCAHQRAENEWLDASGGETAGRIILQPKILSEAANQRRKLHYDPKLSTSPNAAAHAVYSKSGGETGVSLLC